MTNSKYRVVPSFMCKVEPGYGSTDHDIYITYNGLEWSGLTCRNIEDLQTLYWQISQYLTEHGVSSDES